MQLHVGSCGLAAVMDKPLGLSKSHCEPFLPSLGCWDTRSVSSLILGSLWGILLGGEGWAGSLRGEVFVSDGRCWVSLEVLTLQGPRPDVQNKSFP